MVMPTINSGFQKYRRHVEVVWWDKGFNLATQHLFNPLFLYLNQKWHVAWNAFCAENPFSCTKCSELHWDLIPMDLERNFDERIWRCSGNHSQNLNCSITAFHGELSLWEEELAGNNDDVIKWKNFPRYWSFVRGIHPGEFPHKGQWRGALIFSLICTWINDWVNNSEAGDLRPCRAHYDVIMKLTGWWPLSDTVYLTRCIRSVARYLYRWLSARL